MRSSFLAVSAASLLLVATACSDSSGPRIGPPALVEVSSPPTTTGSVKGSLGTFAVKVSDASGQAVSGATVNFTANGGGGITLTPASAATDPTGIASTVVVLGTLAGTATINASVTGVATAASVGVTTTAGSAAKLVASPESIRLNAVGETAQIGALLQDAYANSVTGSTISYTVGDPTLVSVDATGLVKALRVGGITSVVASVGTSTDTISVTVLAPGTSPCTGTATLASIAVGGMVEVSGSRICLGGATANDYTILAYNSSFDGTTALTASIQANGVRPPPSPFRAPSGSEVLAVRSPLGGTSSIGPVIDEAFHFRTLEQSRTMNRFFARARAAQRSRLNARTSATTGRFSPSASYSAIPGNVVQGDLVNLNTSGTDGCTVPKTRTFRVAAIGTKSIVLADTLNPANGFSDADYARFAARFDTLVYPLDVSNFGEPSDFDNNQRVAILFTKSVNELTEAGSDAFVGGFFFSRDLFPKVGSDGTALCPTSNEGEMFYMLVPDPGGVVNGNKHTLGFVDSLTTGVLAHEFQHLINAGRRMYVNTTAEEFEDSWLNEGLSHIAEELLYYRESGKQPRQRLTDAAIRVNSPATYSYWRSDAASNFQRFLSYLRDPGGASPIDNENDELSTRGASWAFLRYAVDRTATSDAGVWQRFGNSTVAGIPSLQVGLNTDPAPLLADFALANYLSDLGVSTDPRFIHQSWNFRDIYANTFVSLGGYPLKTVGIADNTPTQVSVQGGSASYYRLGVAAGGEALITLSSGQSAPSNSLRFTVIRTK